MAAGWAHYRAQEQVRAGTSALAAWEAFKASPSYSAAPAAARKGHQTPVPDGAVVQDDAVSPGGVDLEFLKTDYISKRKAEDDAWDAFNQYSNSTHWSQIDQSVLDGLNRNIMDATKVREAAEESLKVADPIVYNAAYSQAKYANATGAEATGVGKGVMSIGKTISSAPGVILETAKSAIQGEELDMASDAMRSMEEARYLRNAATENAGPVGQFLGNTALDIGQNVVLLPMNAVMPGSSLVAMGAISAADKMYDVGASGGSAKEALWRGVTAGVIEGATEKIGLDNLMDLVKFGGKGVVKNLLKQGGVEAAEEGISYTMNYIADKLAKDPNAQWDWDEFRNTVASGGVSGLFFGLGGSVIGGTNTNTSTGQKNTASASADAAKYTPEEAAKIRYEGKTFKNIVAGIDSTVSEFFNKWKSGRKSHLGEKLEKLYLGKISEPVKQQVSDILGYEVSDRDFIITNDDVKHIMDEHGDAETELKKGNLPLEQWVFDALPDVVTNPDTVSEGHEGSGKNNGKTGVVFTKTLPNGKVVCIQFDNKGRGTMEITTVYAKESTTSMVSAFGEANTRTSKTMEPVLSSTTIIPQTGNGGNTQFAPSAPPSSMDLAKQGDYSGLVSDLDTRQTQKGVDALEAEYQKYVEENSTENALEIIQNDSTIESGATHGAYNKTNDPDKSKRETHANLYYTSLQNSDKQYVVDTISQNTQLNKELVSKMYDHLFVNMYKLETGYKHFDPDYDMAESLQRLREGKNILPHDLILVQHEALEHDLMNEGGLSYDEAHAIANESFNYQEALEKWDGYEEE